MLVRRSAAIVFERDREVLELVAGLQVHPVIEVTGPEGDSSGLQGIHRGG